MLRYILIFLLLLASPAFAEKPLKLVPYQATYVVKYRGFTAGMLQFNLSKGADNTYMYETHVKPGLLARLFIGPDAVERTIMQVDTNGVRPLSWYSEDGKSNTSRDGSLDFDWNNKRVTGTVEDESVDMPLKSGVQDRLSMQVAVLAALQNNTQPGAIILIDGEQVKRYTYELKGEQQVVTGSGRYDTIIYESTRKGSSRIKRVYHSPELSYIPVRVEDLRKGKVETVMELVSVSTNKQTQNSI